MLTDIKEYIEEKGQWVKEAGSSNLHTYCPIHGEEPESLGRLYINCDENDDRWGLWTCFVCGEKGNLNQLRAFFGDPPLDIGAGISEIHFPILEAAAKYYTERLFENPDAYHYLTQKRGLSDEVIVQARLGWCDGGLTKHLLGLDYLLEDIQETGLVTKFGDDYHRDKISIPYLRYGRPTQIRGKEIGGKCIGGQGIPVDIYGSDSVIGERTVAVVEGEFDQLTFQMLGIPTVGVPGALTWKDEWTDELEDARRIYIVLDPDGAGKRGAEKIAAELGPRARIVTMPKKDVDVNDWVVKYGKTKEDFDYLFSKAKGGLLVTVNEAFEKWTEVEGNDRLAGLRTNIPPLDRAMHFGLLPGQVMTLLARTGVGKSIWSINLFHRMKLLNPDVKILFASLEQGRNEWFERAHRIHNFYEPGSTPTDTVEFWKDNILILDKNRINQEELVDSIDQYSYDLGKVPDMVCIDYLGYYARGFPGDAKEKTIAAMMGIKEIARDYQTVIYTPHQANRTGLMGQEVSLEMSKDSSTVEETSDVLLTVWSPDHRIGNEENTGEVHQKIAKCRNGGVGTMIRYQYAPLTLAMVPLEDPLYKRALQEKAWAGAGDSWKEAVRRHQTGDQSLTPLRNSLTTGDIRARLMEKHNASPTVTPALVTETGSKEKM